MKAKLFKARTTSEIYILVKKRDISVDKAITVKFRDRGPN